jgi:2-oxoglutarate dehydrogenase E1 component
VETGVERETLDRIITAVTSAPDDFTIHPKLGKQLEKRRSMLDDDRVDWAMGEAFAFGSLVLEGHPVRLTGQDSRRGTFSQRHSVLIDNETEAEHTPLASLAADQARFMVYDSWLSEYAAMGFEYGYSVTRPDTLTLWEAQFGDFVNGAQIIIDQFLVAAEDKWRQTSGLVLLLPHGYEGQGPEHSSARIERFLVLCAEDNIQVAQPTDAAQYFHLLRRQMVRDIRKPLIVFTPKGLLRAKPATSPSADFTSGSFQEVIRDEAAGEGVRRVLLASGRVAFDLLAARDERSAPAAVVRVEQLYPWPGEQIRDAIASHGEEVTEVVWVQDEPENMGPWPFAHQRLHKLLRTDYTLRHVSRFESASPATGSHTIHDQEQEHLMERAFEGLGPRSLTGRQRGS